MDKITALKNIVANKQHGKVDKVAIDLFTASAIVKLYDNLSPEAQAKYVSYPVTTMAVVAFKLLK